MTHGKFFVGHGLIVEHYRVNRETGRWEELEPIDQNLGYDFDYQQTTHLRREHIVLPVSILAPVWSIKALHGWGSL